MSDVALERHMVHRRVQVDDIRRLLFLVRDVELMRCMKVVLPEPAMPMQTTATGGAIFNASVLAYQSSIVGCWGGDIDD